MIIETVSNPAHETEIKFEDLEPGIIFEFESGGCSGSKESIKALKLDSKDCVLLTYSSGDDWFSLDDGSIVRKHKITKVWGKLVSLKVQL